MSAALVVSVASLSVLTQAAVLAHALLVPHTTCLEHGSVTHENTHESTHAHAATSPSLEAPVPAVPEAWVSSDDSHALEDEHCSVLGTQHTLAPRIYAARPTDERAPAAAQPLERTAAFSSLAQYRLAPKTSPPRA